MTYKKAVVVGSGIAGLLAARVASSHFENVVLIDGDTIPSSATLRPGAAQGSHLHTLLPGGLEILLRYFPEIESHLDSAGGRCAGPADWFAETSHGRTYRLSRFQPTPLKMEPNDPPMHIQSRALLEHVIRAQVEAIPNVSALYETKVVSPIVEDNVVKGVRLISGDQITGADMVFDASGRNALSLAWLAELGYALPQQSEVHCDIGYASAFVRPDDPTLLQEGGFLVPSARKGPFTKRAGSIARIEDDLCLITLSGRFGDYPPKDVAGFTAFVMSLAHSRIGDILARSELVNGPRTYLIPKSVRRRFDQLSAFPEGLLPLGDAICHLNPAYAQGMSLACRQAAELDRLLEDRGHQKVPIRGLWRDFFDSALEQCRAPWVFAAQQDFSKDGTTGDFPHEEKDAIAELKRLNKLADAGDLDAARLADAIFDMRLPLSALNNAR